MRWIRLVPPLAAAALSVSAFGQCDPEEAAKLLASDGAAGDQFGCSVSIDGDTAVIGAYGDDDNGAISGSAYVFVRDGTSWTQQAKLLASDGAMDDMFGTSVCISGDTAIVGAAYGPGNVRDSGAAYVFVRDGTSWAQQAKLTASDGADGDLFGSKVSISGNTAIVGALYDNDLGPDSGSAYVFVRARTSWTQQAKLLASDGAAGNQFGYSVSLSGDTAVVGASNDDDLGNWSGSAYVYELNCECPPDLNGDWWLNSQDLIIFLNAFVSGDPLADWNGDGSANSDDFTAFLNAFVQGC